YAREKKIALGDTVNIVGQAFEVVGTVDTSRAGQVANANLYVPFADAQAMSAASPNVLNVHDFRAEDSNILFIRANPADAPAVAAAAKELLGEDGIVTTPRSFDRVLGSTFSVIDRFGLLVGIAGLVVAAAGLLRTTAAGLWERRRDVALMRAVGWPGAAVLRQLGAETLALTSAGALLGLGIAALVAWGLGFTSVSVPIPWELSPTPMFVAGGPKKMGITVPMDASSDPQLALGALGLAVVAGGLVSLWLAYRAASIRPTEVWRAE
ncbi:MAG: ABC transporter permease, partial [Chloroflexota bacterium]